MRRIACRRLCAVFLCACIFAAALLVGCAWETVAGHAEDLDYGDVPIEVVGLAETDFKITPRDLAALPCVDRRVETKNSYGNEEAFDAFGPLLSEFAAHYGEGRKLTDFKEVRVRAADGYTLPISTEELKKNRYILSFRRGADDALTGDQRPLRLVTPDDSSVAWVYGIVRLEFVR
jgi:hypothetical protein